MTKYFVIKNLPHKKPQANGFTLLEMAIAVTILASISLFTARMIQQGVRSKTKIQADIDSRSGITSALQLMTNDIAKAFNYRDINTELFNAAQKMRREKKISPQQPGQPNTPGQPGQPNTPGQPGTAGQQQPPTQLTPEQELEYQIKPEKVFTRFIGEKNSIHFTTLDPHRPTQNAKVSDQVEVGYYLESCSSPFKKGQTSECLWRRHSSYIDEDIKEGGDASVILENIKSLQFRYLGPGHEEKWVDSWMSEGGEEVMKNNFPYAVEINLVVLDQRFSPPKELGMTVVAPIEFPNNKEKLENAPPTK